MENAFAEETLDQAIGITPEEVHARKQEMLEFYKEQIEFMTTQLEFEKMTAEILKSKDFADLWLWLDKHRSKPHKKNLIWSKKLPRRRKREPSRNPNC
jgi:hypothetical protein